MPYKVNQYVCLVDTYKPVQFKHSTAGRYRVGALNEREAVKFLQKAIGFGSPQVYYKDNDNCDYPILKRGEVYRDDYVTHSLTKVRHANDRVN